MSNKPISAVKKTANKALSLFLRSHKTRQTSISAVDNSAGAADSVPSQSTANSAGASANSKEILETLDALLNTLDKDEALSISEEEVQLRLRRLCEQYPSSQLPVDLPEFPCNPSIVNLIYLAVRSAFAVYKGPFDFGIKDFEHEDVGEIPASRDGSIKATLIRLQPDQRTLVIAFKGSKTLIDWIVNANTDPVDASEFLPGLEAPKVHAGFLYVAQPMLEKVLSKLQSGRRDFKEILFTGHSAGGAVAALVFAHFKLTKKLGNTPLHCITFGAPPTYTPQSITDSLQDSPDSVFLAFTLAGDPVARIDKPYLDILMQIYCSPAILLDIQISSPTLFNAGTVVILTDLNKDAEENQITALLPQKRLPEILFGNFQVHRMKEYLTLVDAWARSIELKQRGE